MSSCFSGLECEKHFNYTKYCKILPEVHFCLSYSSFAGQSNKEKRNT